MQSESLKKTSMCLVEENKLMLQNMRVFQQANSNVNKKKKENWRKGKKSLNIQSPNGDFHKSGRWQMTNSLASCTVQLSRDAGTENRKEASKMA